MTLAALLALSVAFGNSGRQDDPAEHPCKAVRRVNDGRTDAKEALLACFTKARAEGKPVDLPAGRYLLNGTLRLDKELHAGLTIRTYGSPPALFLRGDAGELLAADGVEGLKLVDLDFNGGAERPPERCEAAGGPPLVRLSGCAKCKLERVRVTGSKECSPGIVFDGPEAEISKSQFSGHGTGFQLGSGDSHGLKLRDNLFAENAESQISLLGTNVRDLQISGNAFTSKDRWGQVSVLFGSSDFTGSRFDGNRIECPNARCGVGLLLHGVVGGEFTSNEIIGPRQGAVLLGTQKTKLLDTLIDRTGGWTNGQEGCRTSAVDLLSNAEVIIDNSKLAKTPHYRGLPPTRDATGACGGNFRDLHSAADVSGFEKFVEVNAFVGDLYIRYWGLTRARANEELKTGDFVDEVLSGAVTRPELEDGFFQSPQAVARRRAMFSNVNAGVRWLFLSIFGRDPTKKEAAALKKAIQPKPRKRIDPAAIEKYAAQMADLTGSKSERRRVLLDRQAVGAYRRCFGREPTSAMRKAWVSRWIQTPIYDEVVRTICCPESGPSPLVPSACEGPVPPLVE